MINKKSISRGFSIICLGALLLMSFGPVYAASSVSTESAKATEAQPLLQFASSGLNITNITVSSVGDGTAMRDIVLVIDTSVSMSFETDTSAGKDPFKSDSPLEDPSVCNTSVTDPCQPMKAVKDAALGFLDMLYFPFDRVSIITTTSQTPGGDRNPIEVLALSSNKADVTAAINGIKVFEPIRCDNPGYTDGSCLRYDVGVYKNTQCKIWQDIAGNPDPAISATSDPSSCPSSNVGGVLDLARVAFTENPAQTRLDAFWMVIPLLGGPANATDSLEPNYPNGFCPQYTWTYPWVTPSNTWISSLGRYGDGGTFCRDKRPSVRHHASDPLVSYTNPISGDVSDISYYDSDDYARDKADELATSGTDQGVTIFTIGLGQPIQSLKYVEPGEDPAAESLLKYIAECAGENSLDDCATPVSNPLINHGQYFFAPTNTSLAAIFQVIADSTMPEMNVKGNSTSIDDGDTTPSITDHTDFGNADISSGVMDRIFTIENSGTTSSLNLTGTPKVSVSGTNASDFTVTVNPISPISASSSTTFMVHFDPSAIGICTATISITNNDGNENPHNFDVQGNGTDSSTNKDITAFSFTSLAAAGVITGNNIAVTVPFGTDVTALAATFTTTGASVKVGATTQVSGTTTNDFTSPMTYTVTAADASTQDYTVTVTVAANPAKAITAFSFTSPAAAGTITEATHTIAVTVPFGTNVTALVPTIIHSGDSISPNSGAAQNFTSPVTYTVTAADASTQDYVVTVTVASDVIAPVVSSSVRASASPTALASVTFNITFSESMIGVDANDFGLTISGVSGAAVSGFSGSGSVYTVTVNTGRGSGTIRLDVPISATITDTSGNLLSNLPYITGEIYTLTRVYNLFLPLILR